MQQISRTYSSCVTETLHPLNSNSHFHPLRPQQPPFYSLLFKFDYFFATIIENLELQSLESFSHISSRPLALIQWLLFGRVHIDVIFLNLSLCLNPGYTAAVVSAITSVFWATRGWEARMYATSVSLSGNQFLGTVPFLPTDFSPLCTCM